MGPGISTASVSYLQKPAFLEGVTLLTHNPKGPARSSNLGLENKLEINPRVQNMSHSGWLEADGLELVPVGTEFGVLG